MKVLSIVPHNGIGLLRIGMRPEQISESIKQMHKEGILPGDFQIQMSKDLEIVKDVVILRYLNPCFFFMVQYQNGYAAEISVDRHLRE